MQRALSWVKRELKSKPVRLPKYTTKDSAEETASSVRTLFGVSAEQQRSWQNASTAMKRWRFALETFGIYTFWLPLGETSARGFSLWDDYAPIIALNTHWNNEARIFTTFHELGHLLTRTNSVCLGTPSINNLHSPDSLERWCERFAAAYLLPWPAVTEFMAMRLGWSAGQRVSDIATVGVVARAFKVSLRATAIRLISKNAADASLYSAIPHLADSKPKGGGGTGRTRNQLYGDHYGDEARRTFGHALNEDLMSRADVLSYLKIADSDLDAVQSRD
jgi:Zn-dependent peptidase ImmA (M78 family)